MAVPVFLPIRRELLLSLLLHLEVVLVDLEVVADLLVVVVADLYLVLLLLPLHLVFLLVQLPGQY